MDGAKHGRAADEEKEARDPTFFLILLTSE